MNSNKNNNKNNNKNDEYIYYVSITFKPFDNFNRFINNSIIQNMSDSNDIGDIMSFENLTNLTDTNLTDLFDIIIMQKYRVLYKSDNFYYSRFAICKADEMEKDSKNNLMFFEKNGAYDFYFVRDFKNYLESNLKVILEVIKSNKVIVNNSDSTRWNVINEFIFVSEDDRKNLINNMKDLTDLEKTYKLNSDSYSNNDNNSNRYIKRIENYNPNNIPEISKIDYFIIKKILLDVLNRNGFNNLKDLFGDCKCLVDVLGKIDNFYKEEIGYYNRKILDVKEHYNKKFEEYKKEQNENINNLENVRKKIKNIKYYLDNYDMEEKNIEWVKRINNE